MSHLCVKMRKLLPLQLRNLVRRYITSSSSSSSSSPTLPQFLEKPQFILNFFKAPILPQFPQNPNFSLCRHFSSPPLGENDDKLAPSLSKKLLKHQKVDSLSLSQRLNRSLIRSLHNNVLGFRNWVLKNPDFVAHDDAFATFIDYLDHRRNDFKASDEVLAGGREVIGVETMEIHVDRLVRTGRPKQAVSFFEKMEVDYGFVRDKESLRVVVEKLCDHGHWYIAEEMVKSLANEFSPDEHICDLLIKGWCLDGKLDEARRLAEEMRREGFKFGTNAYNAMLDCVCKLCKRKDPCRLQGKVEKVLIDMDIAGVPFNADTFNVLIKIFCRLERIDHALNVFAKMKEHGCKPGVPTYDLLIGKMVAHGRVDGANALFKEAVSNGVDLVPKAYKIYPKLAKEQERKWETLPLKMVRKRRKLRLSYGKKHKHAMRQAV